MLVDTNIIIDHLNGEIRASELLKKIEAGIIKGYISTIIEAEVLSGSKLSPKQIESILALLKMFDRIDLDSMIAQKAAQFRRKYKCGMVDAIIAATAYSKGVELVTRNRKHFEMISEIKLYCID